MNLSGRHVSPANTLCRSKGGRDAALSALSILMGAGGPMRGLQAGHLIGR